MPAKPNGRCGNPAACCGVVHEWNRDYPSTEKFDLLPSDFSCENEYEFDGTSHKGIVEKKFIRSYDTVSE